MRKIQHYVSAGFVHYITGTISADKATQLVYKLDVRFNFAATAGQRDAARKRKQCSFRIVMYPLPRTTDITFWVLRSEGDNPYNATEQWRDARKDPILWPFLYELRRTPVAAALRAKYKRPNGTIAINPVTWTWRMRREEIERLRWNIRRWVEQRDERLSQLIFGLSCAPGFRSVRADVYSLHRYIRIQCKRRKRAAPMLPSISWVVPRKTATMPLSALLARARRGADTWFPAGNANQKKRDTVDVNSLMETPNAAAQTDEAC